MTESPQHPTGSHASLHLPHLPGVHRARNVNELHDRGLSAGERVADGVAALIGSWRFIIVQSGILLGWIILNVTAVIRHWDPYPFILLNLALSFQAAYSAPIIMMSQNRQAAKDRLQADEDYRVNVLAEHEIARIQAHVEGLVVERWDHLIALQQEQLALLRVLTASLPMPPPHEEQQPPTA